MNSYDAGYTEWLQGLNVGDKVAIFRYEVFSSATIVSVVKITDTQIVTPQDVRFRRTTGQQVGAGRGELRPVDDNEVCTTRVLAIAHSVRYMVDKIIKGADEGQRDVASALAALANAQEALTTANTRIRNIMNNTYTGDMQ